MNITALPALAEHQRLRLVAFFLFYLSQGIPFGLVTIAMPAWLIANGASVGDVGLFLGTVMLPWSFKLVNGMVMDRFCYAPMGRRRAWVIGAQVVMLATLLVTAVLNPAPADITLLTALGFALTLCGAVNDVAIDGMAVDVIPEEEREHVNAWMVGGQTVGISGIGVMSAMALTSGGVASAAIGCAAVLVLLTIIGILLRERPGERLLPWTRGIASAECVERSHTRFLPILAQVLRGLVQWRTALFMAGAALIASTASFAEIFGPAFSVAELGWGSEDYPNLYSIASLILAIAIMAVMGPLVKRFGSRITFLGFAAVMILPNIAAFIVGADAFGTFAMQAYVTMYWAGFFGIIVLIIAWSMNLTNPLVAASQFALFMAIPNFARVLTYGGYAQLIENYGYDTSFLVAALSTGVGVTICLLAGYGRLETIKAAGRAQEPSGAQTPVALEPGLAT